MAIETALVFLGMLTLFTIGFEIIFTYATQGFGYGWSAKRPPVEKSELGKIVERNYRNQVEAMTYLLPALLAVLYLGREDAAIQTAALLMVIGRAGFIVTYLTGISFVRVPFFVMASFAALFVYLRLLGVV